jgi:hypothetical protein
VTLRFQLFKGILPQRFSTPAQLLTFPDRSLSSETAYFRWFRRDGCSMYFYAVPDLFSSFAPFRPAGDVILMVENGKLMGWSTARMDIDVLSSFFASDSCRQDGCNIFFRGSCQLSQVQYGASQDFTRETFCFTQSLRIMQLSKCSVGSWTRT